jgi:hypothetical protein
MPIDLDNDGMIGAWDSPPKIIRRNANTLVIPLAEDEVLALIEELAKTAYNGRTHLVIETDSITYPKSDERESYMREVEPCRCVYPDKCFCSTEAKALRDAVAAALPEHGGMCPVYLGEDDVTIAPEGNPCLACRVLRALDSAASKR